MRTVVIGGGLMGAMAAHLLARRGAAVEVLDVKRLGNATWAGAGIICPEISAVMDRNYVALAMAAGQYYPELVDRLSDYDLGFGRTAIAKVRMAGEDPTAFNRARDIVYARQSSGTFPTRHTVTEVDPAWLREQHPLLGDVAAALYYPEAARVDGRKLVEALRRDSESHGARWVDALAGRIVVEDHRVMGVETLQGEFFPGDRVMVAAGFWSRDLLTPFGVNLELTPHRGQIVHLHTAVDGAGQWPILEGLRGHYILSWPDGRVVAGATRETGTGDAPHFTAEGQHQVLEEAFRVAPGLQPTEVREWRVGLRPAAADGLPILGSVPGVEGCWVITGHGPGGLLCGPYSAHLVISAMLDGKEVPAAFSPHRFA